jgi:hypothetical protein
VGGTPAYRREFARDDTPAGPGDFDAWVLRTVLSPTSPLFREARYLLADEPDTCLPASTPVPMWTTPTQAWSSSDMCFRGPAEDDPQAYPSWSRRRVR